MDQEGESLEAWPLQHLVAHAFPWSCAVTEVSSPGDFSPSMASILLCLDSSSAPANSKTHEPDPKPTI